MSNKNTKLPKPLGGQANTVTDRKLSSQMDLAARKKTGAREAVLDREEENPGAANLGKVISNRYEILDILGEGGWGMVYLAHDRQTDEKLALKLLHPHMAVQPDMRKRFRREAESVSKLCHPNIVKIEDFGDDPDGPYMVMEFIEGVPLDFITEQVGATPVEEVLVMFLHTSQALAHAHERGVIHRDLKPSNIMLVTQPDGSVDAKILDFGLAKPQDEKNTRGLTKLTATGMVLGTADYMSPEQIRAQTLDERSDVYSFGCTVYETVTGHTLFDDDEADDMTILNYHLNKVPSGFERIMTKQPLLRDQMETFLLKCLAKERGKRYQNFHHVSAALEKMLLNSQKNGNIVSRSSSALSLAFKRTEVYAGYAYSNKILFSLLITGVLLAGITCGTIYLLVPQSNKIPDLTARWVPLESTKAVDTSSINQTMQIAGFTLQNSHDKDALADASRTTAECFIAQDQYGEAEKLLQQAIEYRAASQGELSLFAADAEQELGSCFLHDNKLAEAERALERSIGIINKLFSGVDERMSKPMLELGDVKLKQKKYDQAEKCLLAVAGKGDTAMRALAASELGDCYFAQKKLDKAKERYEEALGYWEKAGKTYDINRAICSAELAKTLLQMGTPERADSLYQSAITSLKELSSSKVLYKDVCINYAAFLWSQWRVFDAFAEQSRIQKLS